MQTSSSIVDRDLLNAAYAIGLRLDRKFEDRDIFADSTRTLGAAAKHYAATYEGDFRWMLEQRATVLSGRFLSVGAARGVLNTMMSDARKRLATRRPTPAAAPVAEAVAQIDYSRIPNGRFTVVFDAANREDRLTVAISEWDGFEDRNGQKRDDVRTVKYLAGADNDSDYVFAAAFDGSRVLFSKRADRALRALAILAAASAEDFGAMGAAYAFESSRCWRCNRSLTVEDSVAGGIGPTCADKVGAAYGSAVLDEARAAIARLEAAKAPPAEAANANDGWGEDREFRLNTVDDAPAPAADLDATERRYRELFGEDAA